MKIGDIVRITTKGKWYNYIGKIVDIEGDIFYVVVSAKKEKFKKEEIELWI